MSIHGIISYHRTCFAGGQSQTNLMIITVQDHRRGRLPCMAYCTATVGHAWCICECYATGFHGFWQSDKLLTNILRFKELRGNCRTEYVRATNRKVLLIGQTNRVPVIVR
jgi:hypothetical protein